MTRRNIPEIGLIVSYTFLSLLLFFYSFTQVDLGLTLTRNHFLSGIQQAFQHIGYFNRPLSTVFYLLLLLLFFTAFSVALNEVRRGLISKKGLWITIIIITAILTFAYNAFSYDLFNYIFDAKIFTHYHLNPYQHEALDPQFAHDPMLGFMHWTHRKYPYGIVWLAITVPLSYLSHNIFALNMIFFKLLMGLSFLGTSFFIWKILSELKPKYALFGTAFFALNPFVLIELLVSAHNDGVMFFLLTLALYLLVKRRYALSWVSLFASVGIKFATGFLLPVFAYLTFIKRKVHDWDHVWIASIGCMLIAMLAVTIRTQFQPWYLLYILPFTSLLAEKSYIRLPVVIFSIAMVLQYVPFLYTGNWDPPIPLILQISVIVGLLLGLTIGYREFLVHKTYDK